MNTEILINKAKKGNRRAFLKLIEFEQDKLYRTAFLYTKNKDDALDIVQETICKALISIPNLKEPQYFSTWIIKILINASFDLLRKQKKIVTIDYELSTKTQSTSNVEESIDLIEAIDKLNPKHKMIVILRFFQDRTIKEIADILEMPEGTVKSNLHRALHILKVNLKEDCING